MNDALWQITSLGDALLALAHAARLPHQATKLAAPLSAKDMPTWLDAAATRIGLEANSVSAGYADVTNMLRQCGPAIVTLVGWTPSSDRPSRVPSTGAWDRPDVGVRTTVLVVLSASRTHLRVVAPDLSIRSVLIDDVREALCREVERPVAAEIETLIHDVGLHGRAAQRATSALRQQRLADAQIGGVWMLRAPGHGEVRWSRWLTLLIGSHVIEQQCS
ncbi:MAG: hypothetical protein FD138_4499, partial [Planctomycetota bacterium]